MKCKDIMTRDPVCCVPGEFVTAAAEIMKNDDVGSVPVVDDLESKRWRESSRIATLRWKSLQPARIRGL